MADIIQVMPLDQLQVSDADKQILRNLAMTEPSEQLMDLEIEPQVISEFNII